MTVIFSAMPYSVNTSKLTHQLIHFKFLTIHPEEFCL